MRTSNLRMPTISTKSRSTAKYIMIVFVTIIIFSCLVYEADKFIVVRTRDRIYCSQLTPGMIPEVVEANLRQHGAFTVVGGSSFIKVEDMKDGVVWIRYDNPAVDHFSGGETGLYFRDGKYRDAGVPIRFSIDYGVTSICMKN